MTTIDDIEQIICNHRKDEYGADKFEEWICKDDLKALAIKQIKEDVVEAKKSFDSLPYTVANLEKCIVKNNNKIIRWMDFFGLTVEDIVGE